MIREILSLFFRLLCARYVHVMKLGDGFQESVVKTL